MSVPRAKPWEVASGTSAASTTNKETTSASNIDNLSNTTGEISSTAGNNAVPIPDRPDLSSMASASPYGSNSGIGGYGSSYGSGYGSNYGSRYGGMGSSMYGGGLGSSMYGGYGSGMYGGYGSNMYGMGGYGSSMYGMGGYGSNMYNQPGAMGGIAEGTQATFQLIESIIGAVGGFAQMLEATYMATHSSFFTMISLAEQFGNLKNALGSLLGIFALIKFVKKILYKITGQRYNYGLNLKEFTRFEQKQIKLEENLKRQQSGAAKKISFKPLLLFLAASIGFPYLLSKAIQKINEQQRRKQQYLGASANASGAIDPSNLQFAKALYEFNPENPNVEIELKPNELVAILSKLDPMGNESQWWKVRSRSGKIGYVPSNYLSVIERKKITSKPESFTTTQINQPLNTQKHISADEFKKFEN